MCVCLCDARHSKHCNLRSVNTDKPIAWLDSNTIVVCISIRCVLFSILTSIVYFLLWEYAFGWIVLQHHRRYTHTHTYAQSIQRDLFLIAPNEERTVKIDFFGAQDSVFGFVRLHLCD